MSDRQVLPATLDKILKFHPTVSAYRRISNPKDRHKFLEDVSRFEDYLEPPVSHKERVERMVLDAQIILKTALGHLNKDALNDTERALFEDFFGAYHDEKWQIVYENLKRLQPFADDPYQVDLTITLSDEHLFVTKLNNFPDVGSSNEAVIDTTVPVINRVDGNWRIPREAIFPRQLLSGTNRGSLSRRGSSFCAHALWNCHDGGAERQYTCWRGEEVHVGETLYSSFGPTLTLIHELFHTDLMRVNGKVMQDEKIEVHGELKTMYDEYCKQAARDPESVDKCLNNADSYAYFILGIYMLEQGWDFSGDSKAKSYVEPQGQEAGSQEL